LGAETATAAFSTRKYNEAALLGRASRYLQALAPGASIF
jgi:hypothetical protein